MKISIYLLAAMLFMPAFALAVPPIDIGTGTHPLSIAIGDLNGDANLDLVVGDGGSGNIHVLIGNGAGSFIASPFPVVGANSVSTSLGDFNGDGSLDIVTTSSNGNSISILLGDGVGSYGAPTEIIVSVGPTSIVTSDLDGDGNLDLAVTANAGSSVANVFIFIGDGTGNFIRSWFASSGANSIAVGDLNGDGNPDLAVANRINNANNISIFIGDGTGAFGAATTFPSVNPISIKMRDLNNDGNLDLAVANSYGNFNENVSVLLGNGTGSFGAATYFPATNTPQSIAVGDLNSDGILDLVVADLNADSTILFGDGSGAFNASVSIPAYGPFEVVVADLNGDGKDNLAFANYYSDNISFLLTSHESIQPVGIILINNDATVTSSLNVMLTLNCSDASDCSRMSFSNDGISWSPWQLFSITSSWTLSTGFDGARTVYTKFQDGWGNEVVSNDSIILNTTVIPPSPSQTPVGGSGGCIISQNNPFDPTMILMILLSMAYLGSRRIKFGQY